MKIDHKPAGTHPLNSVKDSERKNHRQESTGSATTAQVSADRVTISGDALHMDAVARAAGDTTSQPSQRVSELKQAIADGTYTIDHVRIASKFRASGI
jgi:negative regulator of flagellin synthesis FlgM